MSNDRVWSSGPTGLRPALCSVISPDWPATLEPLLGRAARLNEEQTGAGADNNGRGGGGKVALKTGAVLS